MSLILEALRKSEAERRRGQVPGLYSETAAGVQPPRRAPPARLWVALAITGAAVLAIALWLAREPAPPTAADVPPAATAPYDRFGDLNGDAEQREAMPGNVRSTETPGDRAGPGATSASTARGQPGAAATLGVPAPATAPSPVPRAAATEPSADPDAPAAALAASGKAPPLLADPPAVVAPASRAPTPDAVPPARATATPSASGSSPLRLSDLPSAQRQQLPPLKMSMHMWSPTQQFAIIDGSRVAKGDRIGDAVVEEITAQGVVLEWHGQRVQIPIR